MAGLVQKSRALLRRIPRSRKELTDAFGRLGRVLDRTERFKLLTITLFIACVFVTSAVLIAFALSRVNKVVDGASTSQLEALRDEQILRIQHFYELTESGLLDCAADPANYTVGAVPVFRTTSCAGQPYVENISFFGADFTPIGNLKRTVEIPDADVITTLKPLVFTESWYPGPFFVQNSRSHQFLFYQLMVNSAPIGYSAFLIDGAFFADILDTTSPLLQTEVYDNRFVVLASADSSRLLTPQIDTLTKKILDGKVATEAWQGSKYSYGHVANDDSPLYVNVWQTQANASSQAISVRNYLVLALAIFLVLTFVVAWKYTKKLDLYVTEDAHRDAHFQRQRALGELTDYLTGAEDLSAELAETADRIKKLAQDLDVMRKQLLHPEGDPHETG